MGRVAGGAYPGRGGTQPSPRTRSNSPAMAAPEAAVRRRRAADGTLGPGSPPAPAPEPAGSPSRLREGTFWLTRIVLLRALAFVYCE